ncbi:MAG: hypothetical protein ACP5N1_00615 [Candidatus Woesearchaeota archaeon]
MTTKIQVIAHHFNGLFLKKDTLDKELQDFYCKESPEEVLKQLISKYHVSHYQSIGLNLFNSTGFTRSDGNRSLINGLKIKEMDSNDNLNTENSIASYSPSFVMGDFTRKKFNEILDFLVRKYLIDIKIIDNGSYIRGSLPRDVYVIPNKVTQMGIQSAINYMDTRKKELNSNKEQNLSDLIVYGRAVMGNCFTEKTIAKKAEEIAKNIPEEFDPLFGPNKILI